jgi:hypothetical protein
MSCEDWTGRVSTSTSNGPVTARDIRGALLVGSMPLADSAAVFTFAARHLGHHLKRIPDGETGSRINWTQWQVGVFNGVDALESEIFDAGYLRRPKFRPKAGKGPKDIVFPPLGYARAAQASYETFKTLRQSGVIATGTRFQVCLPTPVAPVIILVFPEHQRAIEPLYEAAMFKELNDILAYIPADDLAIQWDTAIEFAILEGVLPHSFEDPETDLTARLIRLGNSVPRGVELGFHLCYGDSGGRHFKEPADTSKLVAVANAILTGLTRSLDWLHLPVPKERADRAYFAPLQKLDLKAQTELYLGLVHEVDGTAGTQVRIAAARNFMPRFGVATECGCGRRKPETLPELMAIHTAVSSPIH